MRRQKHRWEWDDDTSLTGHCICGWCGTARQYDEHIGYDPTRPPGIFGRLLKPKGWPS